MPVITHKKHLGAHKKHVGLDRVPRDRVLRTAVEKNVPVEDAANVFLENASHAALQTEDPK